MYRVRTYCDRYIETIEWFENLEDADKCASELAEKNARELWCANPLCRESIRRKPIRKENWCRMNVCYIWFSNHHNECYVWVQEN